MRGACTNQGALHWRDGQHWLYLKNGTLRNEGEFIIETNCEIYPYAITDTFENTGVINSRNLHYGYQCAAVSPPILSRKDF